MSVLRCNPAIHRQILGHSSIFPNPRSPETTASSSLPLSRSARRRLSSALRCKIDAVMTGIGSGFEGSECHRRRGENVIVRSGATEVAGIDVGDVEKMEIVSSERFTLNRTRKIEGKLIVRLEPDGSRWRLVVGCDVEGKWILHWGVSYHGEVGSEWDQPPPEMRPSGSIEVKDYAVETPFKKSVSNVDGKILHEVLIEFDCDTPITAIHFVLKEEETGVWFQHKGRDFRIALVNFLEEDSTLGRKQKLQVLSGSFEEIPSLLVIDDSTSSKQKAPAGEEKNNKQLNCHMSGLHEEFKILKQESIQNHMTVTVRKSHDMDKNVLQFETDVPGNVVVHWGVCKNNKRNWEMPPPPHPPETKIFRHKALQTSLMQKLDRTGSYGIFLLDKDVSGVPFVLKLDDDTWLNNMGTDFFVSLANDLIVHEKADNSAAQNNKNNQNESSKASLIEKNEFSVPSMSSGCEKTNQAVVYTEEIINEIRNLVTDISSERAKGTKSKESQESILREIEKLAAEAYSIFRSSSLSFLEEAAADDSLLPGAKICSGTGSGYEILCQGFNWESHKTGRWYAELSEKAKEIASLGFTIVWLPPPTESVSPEGYMPKDLYNLNSRYGNIEELKDLVMKFHEVGVKVLGDVVLNHRCAHFKNQNGVWNLFGGRLNWDDRAIVADDPHFQGRGNKSSGDNFHAAPNIDHSQEFVRKDLKEWLSWLRKDVGYDGWRLDFVRGFWGGYVKDYMESTEPYFAVGEYWDSLSYTYDEMDYNQDAHRQRIIDWINATNGTAGAFDVTTKGILHTALGKCEYCRLSDEKGKPPGVVGWWPSRAVTFIENHDTGSTQGHWRFPSGKEMQGYAYILTHPGTPAVFYDHAFSHYQQEISRLISLRNRNKLHCRSTVKIVKAEKDVYAAEIDEKVVVKIGPGHYEPSDTNDHKWVIAAEGNDYKVWEAS